ncbi:MAG: hypothetical protein V4709_07465 [Pseudomonadota bacterium]
MNTNQHATTAGPLLIVQPYLTAYRLPVFAEIARHFESVILASSPAPAQSGYGQPGIGGTRIQQHVLLTEVRLLGGRLLWQRGLMHLLWTSRPSRLLIAANPRSLSFWMALLACRLLGIACYSYGQGFYDKPQPPRWLVLTYRLLIAGSRCYICYTASGVESLRRHGISGALLVAENSLLLTAPTPPADKTGSELGVLYLGRLREGCNLGLLIESMAAARTQTALDLKLHVIGDGAFAADLKIRYCKLDWIRWHGERYEQAAVREIARDCRVGCHPGDAGLSVVHFMGLSLIPVIHDRLDLHMGPEPSYVVDGVNGRRFNHAEAATSLPQVLAALFTSNDGAALSAAAFRSYQQLNEPSLGMRLVRILQTY